MAKPKIQELEIERDQATTEIIELALNDIQTLAQAFNLIDEICQVREQVNVQVADEPAQVWLH